MCCFITKASNNKKTHNKPIPGHFHKPRTQLPLTTFQKLDID
jgi:hypothetical protein